MLLQPGSRPVPNYPDYQLIRKLGAGAFGEVWHAHGPGGLDVALKFIRLDTHVRALELRSLEVMKSIRHPNLVSLFGAWHKDNWLILAMELCDRSLLDRLMEALDQELPGIPLDELLGCMSDAADGLDALNAKQVQHRDVKPGNLLLLNSGVKVADFGLAKALEQTVASNSGAGTLAYTAPECFKGQLTQQTDQYSLAVTYYHLRTGQLLFKGDQAQVMYAHLQLVPDLSRLPPTEQAVLTRALSKEPARPWSSCGVFVGELISTQQQARAASHATARSQQNHTSDPTDKEVCWFCKRNEANGKPETVELSLEKAQSAAIHVPKSALCQKRHIRKHLLLFWGPQWSCFVVGALYLLPYVLRGPMFRTRPPEWLDVASGWLCALSYVFLFGGLIWANFWRRRWLRNTVANFSPVRAKLDGGWQFVVRAFL